MSSTSTKFQFPTNLPSCTTNFAHHWPNKTCKSEFSNFSYQNRNKCEKLLPLNYLVRAVSEVTKILVCSSPVAQINFLPFLCVFNVFSSPLRERDSSFGCWADFVTSGGRSKGNTKPGEKLLLRASRYAYMGKHKNAELINQ